MSGWPDEGWRSRWWGLKCALGLAGWRRTEDWYGVFAVRRKPGDPRIIERVRIGGTWEGSMLVRPVASVHLREPGE